MLHTNTKIISEPFISNFCTYEGKKKQINNDTKTLKQMDKSINHLMIDKKQ